MSSVSTRRRQRLPTLFEVLNRRTLPPVDLFAFYVFMRDQQRSVDYLDFWLDVAQHMSLCRHYVRQLRRSVLVATPELEKESSKRSSQVLEAFKLQQHSEIANGEEQESKRVSMILRSESSGSDPKVVARRNSALMNLERHRYNGEMEKMKDLHEEDEPTVDSPLAQVNSSTVTRAHIRESAYKIMVTYFVSGAECELALPLSIIRGITTAIEVDGRDDPEVFDEAKDYVFQAMEREAFPAFLAHKALGNLVPVGAFLRLSIGLFSLFAAFWVAFILIFLDWKPKTTRLWLILPFSLGIYGCLSYQYELDPLIVFAGYSELNFMKFMRMEEPYVKSLLIRRAIWVMCLVILLVTGFCVLFGLVPGKRL
ncbi:RGS domain-containing protein [Lipomyces tetrasporus]|uniref:RGS domain-containing protein n=1 Tax=Lipomyces tetrasporus TaxID=54092 RepID=A0AAD7VWI5_9ASCO|nr:RGS domain-containing protein [Lipomyces tetrasporus]KAJ8104216.1 RGS domain-containing protein [Lipomyces tetrasporus]